MASRCWPWIWTTACFPCPRYITLTSNNGEAVNSVFKSIQRLQSSTASWRLSSTWSESGMKRKHSEKTGSADFIWIVQGDQNTGRCGVGWNWCELYWMLRCRNPVGSGGQCGGVCSSILWQGFFIVVWVLRGFLLFLSARSTCASAPWNSSQIDSEFSQFMEIKGV